LLGIEYTLGKLTVDRQLAPREVADTCVGLAHEWLKRLIISDGIRRAAVEWEIPRSG
jgi:hypothetical protein